jgi:hypothetical protein
LRAGQSLRSIPCYVCCLLRGAIGRLRAGQSLRSIPRCICCMLRKAKGRLRAGQSLRSIPRCACCICCTEHDQHCAQQTRANILIAQEKPHKNKSSLSLPVPMLAPISNAQVPNDWGWPEPCIYGAHTVFLAGKSSNIQSYTVYIYSCGQPYE